MPAAPTARVSAPAPSRGRAKERRASAVTTPSEARVLRESHGDGLAQDPLAEIAAEPSRLTPEHTIEVRIQADSYHAASPSRASLSAASTSVVATPGARPTWIAREPQLSLDDEVMLVRRAPRGRSDARVERARGARAR
jgi:hypothetical protein